MKEDLPLEEYLKKSKDHLEKFKLIVEGKEEIKEVIVEDQWCDDGEPCYEIKVNGMTFELWYQTNGVGEFIYYKDSPQAFKDMIDRIKHHCDYLEDEIRALKEEIDDKDIKPNERR